MRWPQHAIECVRPSRFHPPHCPWPECTAQLCAGTGFQRFGSYATKLRPTIHIPRFRCLDCRRTCSRQTFSTTYYLKRRDLLLQVAAGLAACSAHRQIARSAGCSKTSVTRMAERLGRHAIVFHARCLESLEGVGEPIVHDHFETFVGRQEHALGVGTAVGAESWFLYDVDPAPHRGSGRRPDRSTISIASKVSKPYVSSIRRTLERLIPVVSPTKSLVFVVDGRAEYGAAVRAGALEAKVGLRVFPNPKRGPKGSPRSPEAIERDRAMIPVDQLHQLLRHIRSDHKRETISFGRRLESILGRAHLIAVWKNFIKGRSERKPDRSTPAMHVGLADAPWRWERVFSRRLFPSRVRPTASAVRLYWKRWTPALPELRLTNAA